MGPIRGQVDASVRLQASEWAKGSGSMSEDKFHLGLIGLTSRTTLWAILLVGIGIRKGLGKKKVRNILWKAYTTALNAL